MFYMITTLILIPYVIIYHYILVSTIEKINSGDARFLPVKTGDLPTLSSRDWKWFLKYI
jgi:hypothetical protein